MTDAPVRWQIFTGANPTVERIIPELAVEIGLNESILLMQIAFWVGQSKNVHEGVYWTYNSLRNMQRDYFPYWGLETLRRTIKNLETAGYILIGNFNKRKSDKTQWFALEPDKLSTLKSVLIASALSNFEGRVSQNETPLSQNETALPETSTENKKKTISPDGSSAESKPKTPREPNPMYDAINAIWKYQAARNGQLAKMLQGTSTNRIYKDYNLETPITPDELRQWAAWWRRSNPGLSIIESPMKIQSSITYWQEMHAAKTAPVDPVMDLSVVVPFDPKDNWK